MSLRVEHIVESINHAVWIKHRFSSNWSNGDPSCVWASSFSLLCHRQVLTLSLVWRINQSPRNAPTWNIVIQFTAAFINFGWETQTLTLWWNESIAGERHHLTWLFSLNVISSDECLKITTFDPAKRKGRLFQLRDRGWICWLASLLFQSTERVLGHSKAGEWCKVFKKVRLGS